jgi:NitT/TauT family transport system permease protein
MVRRIALVIAQLGTIAVLLLLWQWAATSGRVDAVVFGQPDEVFDRLKEWIDDGSIWDHTRSTLVLLLLAYLSSMAVGLIVGSVLGVSRWARDIVEPFLMFYLGMPRLILYPFLVVWLGFGVLPKAVFVVLVISPMVAVVTQGAIREVQGELVNNMRLLGARGPDVARHVYAPAMMGTVLATARLTLGKAFAATIFAEFVATTQGLGYLVVLGQQNYSPNSVWAALLILAVVSFLLDTAIGSVADRERWRYR